MAYHAAIESSAVVRSPIHPVPRLQAPFNESMAESVVDNPNEEVYPDAVSRRNLLLEAPKYTRAVSGRWKQRPGEKYHPLWKLIAQISFGIHLLAGGLARSEDEVMQILQSHVDEIDGFLERTTEDLDLASEDIQERLRCLKLPLSHPATFDKMLEDRNFRLSIVNGNEKIEHIAERTSQAMRDSLKDVQKGFDATACLEGYMKDLAQTWVRQSIEHEAVFVAMQGNVEGWRKAFMSLHIKGSHLGGSIKKLTDIINEMQKRAGEVSRRLLHQARGYAPAPDPSSQQLRSTPTGRSTPTSRFAPNKDLPGMPSHPSLRAAGSYESIRPASTETAPHQTLSSRSSTPHLSQSIMNHPNTSRVISQSGTNERDRMNSIGTSILDSRSSMQSTATTAKAQSIDDEEPPERCFPPVELPAHVPEETMSKAPMSKQNRLSAVLKPAPLVSSPKPASKSHTSTLMGLLKSNHILSKSSLNNGKSASISSIERSWMQSITKSNDTSNGKSSSTPSTTLSKSGESKSSAQPENTVDQSGAPYAKNNKRKPKKGLKHWFDALEDDLSEEDKICVKEDRESTIKTTTIQVAEKSPLDQNSIPGTPAWAATKFSSPEIRREGLKFGAFGSHPPQLPPGSPPIDESKTPPSLEAVAFQRDSSQTSKISKAESSASKEVISSTTRPSTNLRPASDSLAWKRKSLLAPEVLSMEKVTRKPVRSMQFVAEMEGSAPAAPLAHEMSGAFVTELEAPQQYFILPPRPTAASDLPLRNKSLLSRKPVPVPETRKEEDERLSEQQSVPPSEISQAHDSSAVTNNSVAVSELGDNSIEPHSHDIIEEKEEESHKDEPGDEIVETQLLLPAMTYIPTPQIPLPPSPLEIEEPTSTEAEGDSREQEQDRLPVASFLLPAVAYRVPASDKRLSEKTLPDTVAPTELAASSPDAVITTTILTIDTEVTAELPPCSEAPVAEKSPTSMSVVTATFSDFVARAPPRIDTSHARSRDSRGSHNGWKAFFTGQPSPASSSLTIRSVRRESLDEVPADQQSPSLLSPSPGGSRVLLPSPTAASVKEGRFFSQSFDQEKEVVRDMYREQDKTTGVSLGLGIQAISVQQD